MRTVAYLIVAIQSFLLLGSLLCLAYGAYQPIGLRVARNVNASPAS